MTCLSLCVFLLMALGIVLPLTAAAGPSGKLIVFHAGSLTVPFDAIEKEFEAKNPAPGSPKPASPAPTASP